MEFLDSTYIDEFITIVIAQCIAVASPGPDFALVVRNSLLHSRRTGVLTALGISCGVIFHVILAIFGLGFLISQSVWMYMAVQIPACGYLFYLAYISFQGGGAVKTSDQTKGSVRQMSGMKAFQTGVLTNLLNPKCILFFLSVFTVVVDPETPRTVLVSYGTVIFFITLAWFLTIALSFSHAKVQQLFDNVAHWIDRITGVVFVLLALKLIWDFIFDFILEN